MLTLRPVEGKFKSKMICAAFAAGAPSNAKGHVFFGVNETNLADWNRVRKSGDDWYYIDNAYFDKWRGVYFRVTKNALQCSTRDTFGSPKRFAKLSIEIKPWRTADELGTDILVCEQSANFMRTIGYKGDWTRDTLAKLHTMADPAHVRVRPWNPDKVKVALALAQELPQLRLIVTHSSASAITALLEGTPAFSEAGAAHELTGPLRACLPQPEGRTRFAYVLAANQFTLEEFKEGVAWRHLNP